MIRLGTWYVHMDAIFGHDDCYLEYVEMCVYICMRYFFLGFYEACLGLVGLCMLGFSVGHGRIFGL